MTDPIEFYFDFSSPYGYFGATRISSIAAKHGRSVAWKPILLGAVFKVTGSGPLPSLPLKGDYARRDMERVARLWNVPYKLPSKFPIPSQAPSRIVYWLESNAPDKQEQAVLALYRAYFVEDRDVSSPETAAEVVGGIGIDRGAALAATQDPAMKDRLKSEVEIAIQKGVFGSPYVFVDGEPFWGSDRLEHVERWLATGGW
ncbi:MAG TPA: 2-hydroxychromene-2-carboxylate isomerase [Burkholderiales bacterium]|nr:2-hydroxychromene-2-carboxylate isomerase [Burkholderiales bacterium]